MELAHRQFLKEHYNNYETAKSGYVRNLDLEIGYAHGFCTETEHGAEGELAFALLMIVQELVTHVCRNVRCVSPEVHSPLARIAAAISPFKCGPANFAHASRSAASTSAISFPNCSGENFVYAES